MKYIILCVLLALTTCLYADEPKSKAIRKYENEVEVLRKQGQAAIKRLEGVFEKEVEKLRGKTLTALQKELDAALESKDLDKAVGLREAIKAFEDAEASGLSAKAEPASKKKIKKRIPRDAVHFGGHRYLLAKGRVTWLKASKEAQELGGYLVRVDSKAEHSFLVAMLSGEKDKSIDFVWTDGSRGLDAKTWIYVTGEQIDFGRTLGVQFDSKTDMHLGLWKLRGWTLVDAPLQLAPYIIEWD